MSQLKTLYIWIEGQILAHLVSLAKGLVIMLCGVTAVLVFCLFFVQPNSLGAQGTTPVPTPPVSTPTQDVQQVSISTAQLDEMRRTEDRLFQSVYWTLGTVVTVAALMVGFSWFSNVRLADRDRQQLRDEIERTLTDKVASDQAVFDDRVKAMEERARQLEEDHKRRFDDLQKAVWTTQFNVLVTIARAEKPLGNSNVVLWTAHQLVTLGKDADMENAITRGLQLMESELRTNASPTVKLVAEINEALEGLPGQVCNRQ